MMDAGVPVMHSAWHVKTIATVTDVCHHVMWKLACTWLIMATVLSVVLTSVTGVMRSASAAVIKR